MQALKEDDSVVIGHIKIPVDADVASYHSHVSVVLDSESLSLLQRKLVGLAA